MGPKVLFVRLQFFTLKTIKCIKHFNPYYNYSINLNELTWDYTCVPGFTDEA